MPRRKNLKFETLREQDRPCLSRKRMLIGGFIVAGTLLIITVASSLCRDNGEPSNQASGDLVPPDPVQQLPPSWSKLRAFKHAAVCADGEPCALIGKNLLDRNGSAVDAALAALICNGLINMQSMGLGGGFIMTIYDRENNRSVILNARDVAPGMAHAHMYDNATSHASQAGPQAMAVPGELAGYWEAHRRFGKLPWADIFQPSIELCEKGYNLTKIQYEGLLSNETKILNDPYLRELFVNPATGKFVNVGSTIRPKELCQTMKIIAEKNATEFYNGTLGKTLVEDLRKRGSIITFKDLNNYRAKWEDPVSTTLNDGTKVYTPGIPASGGLVSLILNIFDEFHFSPIDLASNNSTIRTYHRILETYKYAYALRTQMGDVQLPRLFQNLTSKDYAHSIRMSITDNRTWENPFHYGTSNFTNPDDHGTAHISVIAANGDAVSVTSTINMYFGCGIVSERTGILMNSGMDDFGLPGILSYFGLPANPNNYIRPGKRPLSSMSPTILVDKDGEVKMVIGAAGGTKITTSVPFVIARHLWMRNTVKEAVDAPRIHHQLYPMKVFYEYGVPKPIIDGLKALGHVTSRYRHRGSVICMLVKLNDTIYANADYRKGGDVYGID